MTKAVHIEASMLYNKMTRVIIQNILSVCVIVTDYLGHHTEAFSVCLHYRMAKVVHIEAPMCN